MKINPPKDGLHPQLVEIGKIKIGRIEKHPCPPKKLDYFKVVLTERNHEN